MDNQLLQYSESAIKEIREAGLYKDPKILEGKQGAVVRADGREYINFCSNNYLGLAGSEVLVQAAKDALDRCGYGLSSVRFICGNHAEHAALEREAAKFLGKEDALAVGSCWDANEGLFSALFGEEDALISDELNHASLIDGMRLAKAQKERYAHMDMKDLETKLQAAQEARMRAVVTDGVFSMDGHVAPLPEICSLAERYGAIVIVDDSHATGFMGGEGRGTPEHFGVEDRVDIITTTFGKALGGASGGCIAGKARVIELLRQRMRTYLFTNSLPLVVTSATMSVLQYVPRHPELRAKLWDNVGHFRTRLQEMGFPLSPIAHPIVPVMIGDEKLAQTFARELQEEGLWAVGFSYPVVPKGKARVRIQISAAHTKEHIDRLAGALRRLGDIYGLLRQ